MPKINREEYEVLKELDDKWKWIARDKDRGLYAFTEKPVRKHDPSPYWDTETEGPYTALELFDEIHLFQFIQWEDDEPYNIAELIKEYEFGRILLAMAEEETVLEIKSESGETEVKKDIEWFEDELEKLQVYSNPDVPKDRNDLYTQYVEGINDTVRQVKMLVGELDEPEVLSQEFINEKAVEVYADTADAEVHVVFRMRDLQNLLVPKQEEVEEGRVRLIVGFDGGTESCYATDIGDALDFLTDYDARFTVSKEPIIPKFVAEHIENRRGESLAQAYNIPTLTKVGKWLLDKKNCETFARAWIFGYTVEEEQKYTVELPSAIEHDDMWPKVALSKLPNGELQVRKTKRGTGLKLHDKYLLTENEIKDYDDRYWPFAVKVEELEE